MEADKVRRLLVDDVMNAPVYTIEDTHLAGEALAKMEANRVKKILVVSKDGSPVGVLEAWKVTKMDVGLAVGQLELSPPKFVPVGTSLPSIQDDLRNFTAVYVTDPNDPKKLLGVVTAYDAARLY